MRADLDVAVLGGGLAGNLLARQLVRRMPGLRVAMFERSLERSYKVGESTVEIASHYLVRRLGLSRYLYEQHLPKNGIRYFFDSPERDLPLEEMSELGTINLPFHPTFQIDRARMEADLLDMNAKDGVDVRLGAEVAEVELAEAGDGPHTLVLAGGERATARWLVDAGGREGFLARRLDWRVPEVEHRMGSAWARFEGVADIDALGSDEFHARVRHTSRHLSTLHFHYPGYWIWVIPLGFGITSVGVTGVPVREASLRTPEGLRRFLLEHGAMRELLADAKALDFGSLARIAYGTKRFFDPRRIAVIGEAATAADPLYSPGSDFIALENDFVTELVAREETGDAEASRLRRTEIFDDFMAFRHQSVMRLYRGLYGMLGSFELMRLKWDFDIASYHNLWVSPYMTDMLTDTEFVRRQVRQQRFVLGVLDNFRGLFERLEKELVAKGAYHRKNRGMFSWGLENIDFLPQIGLPRSREETLAQAARTFNIVRRDACALLGQEPGEPWPLQAFVTRSLG
jgi:flavin-dependent dehydrogenase